MKKKLISVSLLFFVVLHLFSISPVPAKADYTDMPGHSHWSHPAVTAAVENGLLRGDNGKLMPQENLTRGQMAAVINRAFGARRVANIGQFDDVNPLAWYYSDIAKAVAMGTFQGSSDNKMRPDEPIIREEAFVVLARAIKLAGDSSDLDIFSDREDIHSWAAPYIAAMAQGGYVKGSDGKLNPARPITREEFAQLMFNIIPHYISDAGIYTEDMNGNVLIRSDNVTLKGVTVKGDLILGEGVGNGDITLDGVTVTGRLIVRAGGEDSIHIINKSNVGSIVVGKTGDGGVRIRTEEGCRVDVVYIDDGNDDIILEGIFNQVAVTTDAPVILKDAKVTGLTVSAKNADIKLEGVTAVSSAQIAKDANGAAISVGANSSVTKVDSSGENVTISGEGKVVQVIVSGSNTAVNTQKTQIIVREGATGITQNGSAVKTDNTGTGSSGKDSGDDSYIAKVTSLAQLQSALAKNSVSSIIITGEIGIPESVALTFNKPVTVADEPGAILIVGGSLTNNSNLTSKGQGSLFEDTGIILDGSVENRAVFINNGTFVNESRFAMFEARFTNNKTVINKNWFHCAGTGIVNNGSFTGTGDITLLNSDNFEVGDNIPSTFLNSSGATFMLEGPGILRIFKTCSLTNDGTITAKSYFDNYGTLTNNGSFTYVDLINAGTVEGTLTPCDDKANREDFKAAETFEELKSQLASLDAGFDGIAVVSDITLTEDLEIFRYVLVGPDGSLEVPEGRKLTVASSSGKNDLVIAGKFYVSGTLETTRTGEGDEENVGRILINGALQAHGAYVINNYGEIIFYGGEMSPEDMVINGNPVQHPAVFAEVADEAGLVEAMANDRIKEIAIVSDITLTKDLEIVRNTTVTYDTLHKIPRKFTIPENVKVTVKDGGRLSILGDLVNSGMLTCEEINQGIFVGSQGSFINNIDGILNVDGHIDVFEGRLENYGSLNISGGNEHILLAFGAFITNHEGATFTNDGSFNLDTSDNREGAVYRRGSSFVNAGTFENGGISDPASGAYFGMMIGTFTNSGGFVNNGYMDLNYTSFTHSKGTFSTYNTGGLSLIGGGFDIAEAPEESFVNNGYMRLVDEYGKGGTDRLCSVTLGENKIENNSHWIDHIAAVYSQAGLDNAETAQRNKISGLGDKPGYYGFSTYNRLNFMEDIEFTDDTELSAFGNYWAEAYWTWDEAEGREKLVTVKLTVAEGVTFTVNRMCGLLIGGILENNGTIITAPTFEDDKIHEDGGYVDIWPEATFTNNGAIVKGGNLFIRHEYGDSPDGVIRAKVTGLEDVSAEYIAMVHDKKDFIVANDCRDPIYGRIEIKGDSLVVLTGNEPLTVNKNMFIEPGSGLVVSYGSNITFAGDHWINNCGDISIFGDMTVGGGVCFFNEQNMDIGSINSGEAAKVTIASGGNLFNKGNITIYHSGTLDARDGVFADNDPNGPGTFLK